MRLKIENCGPIRTVDMEMGKLTILVGPQASGKSIALQLYKLALEYPAIKRTMVDFAFDPTRGRSDFMSDYMGEGMGALWRDDTVIEITKKKLSYDNIKATTYKDREHSVFYIPAQRVLTFENGWPKRFLNYDASVPFVVREFSEALFVYLDKAYSSDSSGKLFPHPKSLRAILKESLNSSVYRSADVSIDKKHSRKRLVLEIPDGSSLPMSTWSAGQREFTPLMLGLYKLIPASAKNKDENISTVIIEEPEMGLHPKAIGSFMFVVMELLFRGYSVVISTHSPAILEVAWALRMFRESTDVVTPFCSLFGTTKRKEITPMALALRDMDIRVHFFKPESAGTVSKDISGMDPSGVADEADWGGLTEQSTRISQLVAEAAPDYGGAS